MKKASSDDRLKELMVAKREGLVALHEVRDSTERRFNEASAAYDEALEEFRGLLSTWRKVHDIGGATRDDEIWPFGFLDIDHAIYSATPVRAGSDADAAEWELQNSREPLHVDELIRRIRERTGRAIQKASLVSTMSRLAKKEMLFVQTGPNTFGSKARHAPSSRRSGGRPGTALPGTSRVATAPEASARARSRRNP